MLARCSPLSLIYKPEVRSANLIMAVGQDHKVVTGYNEREELSQILNGFEEKPDCDCSSCGGAGWINCTWCHGVLCVCLG